MSPSEATLPGQALSLVVTRGICSLRSSLTADVAVSHLCEQAAGGDACLRGRALPNVRAYVLDGQPQAVPVEVTRRVQVLVVGVGRGCMNCLELPATDPLGATGRLRYKTRDLTRYQPVCSIEFLERMNHRVKIRGFRIELTGVEAATQRL